MSYASTHTIIECPTDGMPIGVVAEPKKIEKID